MADPWAILLIHFKGDTTQPFQRSWYEELFSEKGKGQQLLYDWFLDNSHGRADLTGTTVFGWYELDLKMSEYAGSGASQAARDAQQAFLALCKRKALDEGVALDDFRGVVVVLNTGRDLFGGPAGAVGGDDGKDFGISGSRPRSCNRR